MLFCFSYLFLFHLKYWQQKVEFCKMIGILVIFLQFLRIQEKYLQIYFSFPGLYAIYLLLITEINGKIAVKV